MRARKLPAVALVLAMAWASRVDAEPGLEGKWDDDFVLESDDGAFRLAMRGNVHLDTRFYQGENVGAPNSFDVRRGRMDLRGCMHRWFSFRVQAELAGQPYLRNAWVDAGPIDWLHLRVGQMKVPFSSSWLTLDNNVNFVERGTSTPVYPFFDRGLKLWGKLLDGVAVYDLGVYTGVGTDLDVKSGDIDDHQDIAGRVLLQPFRKTRCKVLEGLFLAAEETWGRMSVPTRRLELGGLRAANYESAIWRWRTERVLGTDGRVTDQVAATAHSRARFGAELHYLLDWFALSAEYLQVRYRDIEVYHDLMVGSSRRAHERLFGADGAIRSFSVWASAYLTGESKRLTESGWKTARPKQSVGEGGPGAIEVRGRYSWTDTDERLFRGYPVSGWTPGAPGLPADYTGSTPGAPHGLQVSILEGAHEVHEMTLGLSWTLNPMVRIQLDDVLLLAPSRDRDGDGENDNRLLSGAKSDQADPDRKGVGTSWENAVMCRFILKV